MSNETHTEAGSRLEKLIDVQNEARDFSMKFRNPNKTFELKKGLTIDDVLGEAGFKQVGFADLDPALQDGIKKTKSKNWYGYPLNRKNDAELPSSKIFINENKDTIYCVAKPGKVYSWSRIEKTADSYRIDEINHDSNIGEAIDIVIFYEINYRQMPDMHPRYTGNDIIIPIEKTAITEETRGEVDRVIGTA